METLPQTNGELKMELKLCDQCTGEENAGLKFCSDCKEMLCKACVNYHNRVKALKDHKLIDVAEKSADTSQKDMFLGVGKCAEHPERDVEIYCKSHDAVICFHCSTFLHNACEMTKIAGNDIDVTKVRTDSDCVIAQMKTSIKHLELLQKLKMENKTNFQQKLKEIKESIKQVRDQVVMLMNNIVSQVSEVATQMENERNDGIDAEMSRVTKVKDQMEQSIALLNRVREHGSEKDKFVSAHLMIKQFEEISKQVHEEDRCQTKLDAKLVIADDLRKLIDRTDIQELVDIQMTESESNHTSLASEPIPSRDTGVVSNALRDSKLAKTEEHVVRPDTGNAACYNGIAVCKDGRVIICNYSNGGYLHLYNPNSQTQLKLKLARGYPFSAVQIDDTHLAVSSGEAKTISIVSVGNKKLKVEKTLHTQNKPCTVVALNNGHIAVAWYSPAAFGVIDISGKKIFQKSYLDQDTNGRKFKPFDYLAVDESRQHVIQPCDGDKAVYCFDFTGNPVFKYTEPSLADLRGVALDKCGNIYVCESSNNSIHKLSPSGDAISVITEGVPSRPRAICSDVTGRGFWVTRGSSPRENVEYFRLEQNK